MVKKGIVLDHVIFGDSIEVDKVKIDLISNLPRPIFVKDVRPFLRYARLYRSFIQNFSKIPKPFLVF